MEKLKLKHDHTLTNILKVFILSIFLMLPIFTWLPTAFYYGFNEHATNPNSTDVQINYRYQTNEINTLDDMILGNLYYCEDFYLTDDVDNFDVTILRYDNLDLSSFDFVFDNFNLQSDFDSYITLRFTYNSGTAKVYYYVNNYMHASSENEGTVFYSFGACNFIVNDYLSDFKDIASINAMDVQLSTFNIIESVDIVETEGISNAMYKSWQDVWTQPLFNWTGNNNFEFTINAFTSVFGITPQSYITNYINYLLTLTAIYIVFDIIIMVFVKLTHIFGNE